MRYITLGCFALLLLVTATANAQWMEASSDHFVIYGEDETDVRGFAQRLERFHAAMAHVFVKPQTKPGPSNRVTIFVVSSASKVRQVAGIRNKYVAGFYRPRAGSSVAVIPDLGRASSRFDASSTTVLLHEYAHHFMRTALTTRTFPLWFTEGFAEFLAGAHFKEDGSVLLGTPANHRALEIAFAANVPIRTLLVFDVDPTAANARYESFYGRSWALYHYLQMAPERAGQLFKYQKELAAGRSGLEAAQNAFGDLDKLEDDVGHYMKRKRLNAMVVDGAALNIGSIVVRELRPGENAMMPTMMESKIGVTDEEAEALVPEARKVAQQFPNDPAVLSALAEAEFDAGNDDEAIAAADRAIAIDPKDVNAHIQKGYALAHKVDSGALPKEAWRDVRAVFIKANGIENDHPIPLLQFYVTYKNEGEPPTKNAIAGLEWALELAPFDNSLRWMVARQMIADERFADAAKALAPLAYSPHPGDFTDRARQTLQEVEARLKQ